MERRPVVGMTGPWWATEAILGCAIGAALFSVVIAVLFLLGNYEVQGIDGRSAVLATLLTTIRAAVTELTPATV